MISHLNAPAAVGLNGHDDRSQNPSLGYFLWTKSSFQPGGTFQLSAFSRCGSVAMFYAGSSLKQGLAVHF
jgi:hypothetical protein